METSPSHSNSNRTHDPSSYTNSLNSLRTDDDLGLLRSKYKHSDNKVYHDFYKTKMCSLYNLNICKKGNDCPFAHSEDELREKPNLLRTKLCEAFLVGQCDKGDECSFAHGEDDLRSTPDLFKTAICNLWTQGKCTAGESCRFAHGYDDLRPAPSHQKFKKRNPNKPYKNKNFSQKTQYNDQYNTQYNNQFNNQYPYPQNVYNYPMYPMSMMPREMENVYGMPQPYGYGAGMYPQVRKH